MVIGACVWVRTESKFEYFIVWVLFYVFDSLKRFKFTRISVLLVVIVKSFHTLCYSFLPLHSPWPLLLLTDLSVPVFIGLFWMSLFNYRRTCKTFPTIQFASNSEINNNDKNDSLSLFQRLKKHSRIFFMSSNIPLSRTMGRLPLQYCSTLIYDEYWLTMPSNDNCLSQL